MLVIGGLSRLALVAATFDGGNRNLTVFACR
jgi:hypothetical protein